MKVSKNCTTFEAARSAAKNNTSRGGRRVVLDTRPRHLLEEVTFEWRPECSVGVSHEKIWSALRAEREMCKGPGAALSLDVREACA